MTAGGTSCGIFFASVMMRLPLFGTAGAGPRYFASGSLYQRKLSGWPTEFGRAPGPDDLIVPTPKPTNRGPRVAAGAVRDEHFSYKRLQKDLAREQPELTIVELDPIETAPTDLDAGYYLRRMRANLDNLAKHLQ